MIERAFLAASLTLAAAGVARAGDEHLVAIRAGAAITVTGEEFRPAVVVIRDGKIEAVGERVDVPPQATVIDAPDEVVMPGLVLARTRFGMGRVSRAGVNSQLSALDELTLRPGDLRPLLEGGYVAAGLIPGGRGVAGRAAVVRPYLEDGQPVVLTGAGYLRVSMASLPSDKRALAAAFKEAQAALDRIEKAREAFEKKAKEKAAKEKAAKGKAAKGKPAEEATFEPPPIPGGAKPFAAILQESDDRPRVLVEVNHARDMIHFEDGFARYETFDPAFFAENDPSSDLFRVLDRLAGKLVVMQPQLSFESDTRTPRNLPAEVAKLGAKLVLVPLGDAPGHLRDFLEAVAFLVRDGLPRDVALKALTLHPAELLGLGGELGAIEAGLRADLIFLDGDPLGASPHVTRVMIGGELREPEGARQ